MKNQLNILVSSISNNDHDRSRDTDNKYRPSFEKFIRTTVNWCTARRINGFQVFVFHNIIAASFWWLAWNEKK